MAEVGLCGGVCSRACVEMQLPRSLPDAGCLVSGACPVGQLVAGGRETVTSRTAKLRTGTWSKTPTQLSCNACGWAPIRHPGSSDPRGLGFLRFGEVGSEAVRSPHPTDTYPGG